MGLFILTLLFPWIECEIDFPEYDFCILPDANMTCPVKFKWDHQEIKKPLTADMTPDGVKIAVYGYNTKFVINLTSLSESKDFTFVGSNNGYSAKVCVEFDYLDHLTLYMTTIDMAVSRSHIHKLDAMKGSWILCFHNSMQIDEMTLEYSNRWIFKECLSVGHLTFEAKSVVRIDSVKYYWKIVSNNGDDYSIPCSSVNSLLVTGDFVSTFEVMYSGSYANAFDIKIAGKPKTYEIFINVATDTFLFNGAVMNIDTGTAISCNFQRPFSVGWIRVNGEQVMTNHTSFVCCVSAIPSGYGSCDGFPTKKRVTPSEFNLDYLTNGQATTKIYIPRSLTKFKLVLSVPNSLRLLVIYGGLDPVVEIDAPFPVLYNILLFKANVYLNSGKYKYIEAYNSVILSSKHTNCFVSKLILDVISGVRYDLYSDHISNNVTITSLGNISALSLDLHSFSLIIGNTMNTFSNRPTLYLFNLQFSTSVVPIYRHATRNLPPVRINITNSAFQVLEFKVDNPLSLKDFGGVPISVTHQPSIKLIFPKGKWIVDGSFKKTDLIGVVGLCVGILGVTSALVYCYCPCFNLGFKSHWKYNRIDDDLRAEIQPFPII